VQYWWSLELLYCLTFGLLVIPSPAGYSQDGVSGGLPAAREEGKTTGIEVLTRGPVHEAFAQPVNLGRGLALIITGQPPEPINETPPDLRPESGSVVWIPGYWSWDSQGNDFVWVTGVWRVPPPGMQWIPGYWATTSGGYRWVPGFWTPADARELQYYPTPPPPIEQASSSEPPSPDDFWAPGFWNWRDDRFLWKAGYWAQARPGWVWTPTSYYWTPRGYVCANGYWDYALDNRGMLFAPLAIDVDEQDADSAYTPAVAIDPALLSFYLFVRPAYGHYYFGDYFSEEYVRLGIYPWYGVNRFPDYSYDPLFAYDSWYYRERDPDWIHNLERWTAYYRRHPEARPPHDLTAEEKLAAEKKARPDREFLEIGRPLGTVWQNSIFPMRLARLTPADRSKIMETVQSTRDFQTQRSRVEAIPALQLGKQPLTTLPGPATASTGPQKAALPRRTPPVVAQNAPRTAVVRATSSMPFSQRQGQETSPLARAAVARPGGQAPTVREVWKPIVEPGESAGTRPGWSSEPPPATVPERSLPNTRGNGGGTEGSTPPRRVEPNPNPQLGPALALNPDLGPGNSWKSGPAPRHPRAPSEEPPAASRPGSVPQERDRAPPQVALPGGRFGQQKP